MNFLGRVVVITRKSSCEVSFNHLGIISKVTTNGAPLDVIYYNLLNDEIVETDLKTFINHCKEEKENKEECSDVRLATADEIGMSELITPFDPVKYTDYIRGYVGQYGLDIFSDSNTFIFLMEDTHKREIAGKPIKRMFCTKNKFLFTGTQLFGGLLSFSALFGAGYLFRSYLSKK